MNSSKKILTVKRLINTSFPNKYKKLILNQPINNSEKVQLLSVAVILINHEDQNLQRLGYRIALLYGLHTKDYIPLYELALNNGLMPVAHLINELIDTSPQNRQENFYNTFIRSHIDTFEKNNIFFTEQQFLLNHFFNKNNDNTVTIVAPTSYGKSELILKFLVENPNRKICIIVPTKALLAQTRKRILCENISWISKIIIHHEMYKFGDELSSVFVLTQERLQRLLNMNPKFSFDIVFVDEAHNLLESDSRTRLLASVICILEHRNVHTAFKFLTPFIVDTGTLKVRYTKYQAEQFKINEYVKSERFYLTDFRNGKKCNLIYDQFLNQFFDFPSKYKDLFELIKETSTSKNIIYLNSPKKLQKFAVELSEQLETIDDTIINEACKELAKHISKEYVLIDCLKKGVVYHHGSVPDTVRLYIENLFSTSKQLKYLVSSSTLLEGVNLPIETLYLLDYKKGQRKLTPSQFKNLIGRVSRFNDVFKEISNESIGKLAPKIYLVGTDNLISKDANLKDFIQTSMNVQKQQKDEIHNELLNDTIITEKNCLELEKAKLKLSNLETGIIGNNDSKLAKTKIGKLLFTHNVEEIDIFEKEFSIQEKIDYLISTLGNRTKINNSTKLLEIIATLFISEISDGDGSNKKYNSLSRLEQSKAQQFYSMVLDWKTERLSMNEMVNRICYYWGKLPKDESIVFVSSRWGDIILNGYLPLFTNISEKNEKERINLAIVRIKEEEDFFENNLFKFVDILYECGLIEEIYYYKIKYGTDDPLTINLIRNGFSLGLSNLMLSEKYYNDLIVNDDSVFIKSSSIEKMKNNKEGSFIIFEASLFVKEN